MEPENFSEPEAQAFDKETKDYAASEELAAKPEEARRRFEAIVAELREAFAAWVAAKEEQFEQVLELGWAGQAGNAAVFLKQLDEERKRLWVDAAQTDCDIEDTPAIIEQEEKYFQRMERMKSIWATLCADGVCKDQWPLDDRLVLAEQLRAQAEVNSPRSSHETGI